MSKFPWGRPLGTIEFVLEDKTYTITKYHPHKSQGSVVTREIDTGEVWYHNQDIRESSPSLTYLYLAILAYAHLGDNQYALASGLARALGAVGTGEGRE